MSITAASQRSLPKIIRERILFSFFFFLFSFLLSFVSFYFDPMRNNKFTTLYSSRLWIYFGFSSSSMYLIISFFFFFPFDKRAGALLGAQGSLVLVFAPCWGPAFAVVVMGPGRAGIIITIEREDIEPRWGVTLSSLLSPLSLSPHGQFPLVPTTEHKRREKPKEINMNLLCQFPVQID